MDQITGDRPPKHRFGGRSPLIKHWNCLLLFMIGLPSRHCLADRAWKSIALEGGLL